MSKKSSTFVADLGIVPSITCKNVLYMAKSVIVKIAKGNEIWSVQRMSKGSFWGGECFRVYCGRRWYSHVAWETYEYALACLLRQALGIDIHGEEVKFL